ncbi:type IV secretion system protein [Patescibacteria group bacterium]|nr:type IV secretion system protein [Patescibacteria group bacterium]
MNDFFRTPVIRKAGTLLLGAVFLTSVLAPFLPLTVQAEPGDRAANAGAAAAGLPPAGEPPAAAASASPEVEASNGGGDELNCDGVNSVLCTGINVILQPVIALLYIVFFLANGILWVSAQFLNGVLLMTVLQFGQNFGNSEGLLTAWGVLRDLGNVFLLFSFVFMGLSTILNLHDYTVKKALPKLIIFAVLLNFSLFVAEAVIDVANGVSTAIVAQSSAGLSCDTSRMPAGESAQAYCARHYGVTGLVMQFSGGSTLLNSAPEWEAQGLVHVNYSLRYAMTMAGLVLFSTILSVVFFAAGIMLIIRVVVLLIVMVTSPIGFAGMAVPFLSGLAKQWWQALIKQSLFVPVFLLIVFIGFKVVDSSSLASALNNGSLSRALVTGEVSATDIFVVFALTIGFMIAALMVAQKLGAAGADFAIKTAGGATYGTLAFLGRRTMGQAALNLASAARRNAGLMRSPLGRPLANILDKGAASSFDFRASGAAKFATGKAGINAGTTTGAAAGGLVGVIKGEKEKKLHHYEAIEEENERRVNAHIERYDTAEDKRNKAAKAGDTRLVAKFEADMRDAQVEIDKTAMGRKKLREKNWKKVDGEFKEVTAAAQERAAEAERFRASADEMERTQPTRTLDIANLRRQADEAAAAAANYDARLLTLSREHQRAKEAFDDASHKLHDEEMSYIQELSESADFWNPIPWGSVGYRADREAAFELRRLQGRSDDEVKYEKLLGAVKNIGAGGGHGGGDHGAVKPLSFTTVEESAHGDH